VDEAPATPAPEWAYFLSLRRDVCGTFSTTGWCPGSSSVLPSRSSWPTSFLCRPSNPPRSKEEKRPSTLCLPWSPLWLESLLNTLLLSFVLEHGLTAAVRNVSRAIAGVTSLPLRVGPGEPKTSLLIERVNARVRMTTWPPNLRHTLSEGTFSNVRVPPRAARGPVATYESVAIAAGLPPSREPRASNPASPVQGTARAHPGVWQPRRPGLQPERFPTLEIPMSLGTIVIIALVVLFLSGGGFYWSRR